MGPLKDIEEVVERVINLPSDLLGLPRLELPRILGASAYGEKDITRIRVFGAYGEKE